MNDFTIKDDVRLQIRLVRADGPDSIGGTTSPMPVKNGEGYLVWVNTVHSEKRAAASWLHEALHIYHNDFDDPRPVKEIEAERRAELRELLEILIEEDKTIDGDDPYDSTVMEDAFRGRYLSNKKAYRPQPAKTETGTP